MNELFVAPNVRSRKHQQLHIGSARTEKVTLRALGSSLSIVVGQNGTPASDYATSDHAFGIASAPDTAHTPNTDLGYYRPPLTSHDPHASRV